MLRLRGGSISPATIETVEAIGDTFCSAALNESEMLKLEEYAASTNSQVKAEDYKKFAQFGFKSIKDPGLKFLQYLECALPEDKLFQVKTLIWLLGYIYL
jgi:hypothetical protein